MITPLPTNKLDEKRFYVYLHRRLDSGVVFYVGRGTGDRAYRKNKRNDRGLAWQRIAFSVDYEVEIIKDGLTEQEASDLETKFLENPDPSWELSNVVKRKRGFTLSFDLLNEYFAYEESSPSCLVWKKIPSYKRKHRPAKLGDTVGYLDNRGYYRIHFMGYDLVVHRVVFFLATGKNPGLLLVDHVNGVKTDNRVQNLRLVSKQENALNRDIHREFNRDTISSNLYLFKSRDSIVFQHLPTNYIRTFPLSLFVNEEAAYSVARMFRNTYLDLIKEF